PMTLVWQDPAAHGPRLHAFIAAVADYPHLLGGHGPLAANTYGLSQVGCPAPTGIRIADWLISGQYKNPGCPLGSVEMVLSPANNYVVNGNAVAVDAATMANITAAATAWYGRCNTDPGNIAFFYFVGHGLERVQQYLLPEDFGNPAVLNPWANCI